MNCYLNWWNAIKDRILDWKLDIEIMWDIFYYRYIGRPENTYDDWYDDD